MTFMPRRPTEREKEARRLQEATDLLRNALAAITAGYLGFWGADWIRKGSDLHWWALALSAVVVTAGVVGIIYVLVRCVLGRRPRRTSLPRGQEPEECHIHPTVVGPPGEGRVHHDLTPLSVIGEVRDRATLDDMDAKMNRVVREDSKGPLSS